MFIDFHHFSWPLNKIQYCHLCPTTVHPSRLSSEKNYSHNSDTYQNISSKRDSFYEKIPSIQKIIPVTAIQFMILSKLETDHSQCHLRRYIQEWTKYIWGCKFKGCLPQILLGPFLNTLSYLYLNKFKFWC